MALNTRVLQTELMVAALSCDEQQRYNAFVTNYRSHLEAQGASLRAWFGRAYGSASESELNAFVTKLANDASKRSLDAASYCASVGALLSEVLETPTNGYSASRSSSMVSNAKLVNLDVA
ncbi:MAG: hypothetical protein ACXW3M_15440 [Rhodoplanes sp.]